MKLTDYADSYFTTALWSSLDSNDEPLDANYSFNDLAAETIEKANKDIDYFLKRIEVLGLDTSAHDSSKIMHDLWLTRNRHGTGFWDGDYEDTLGEALTKLSKELGQVDLYVGDDGKIYC